MNEILALIEVAQLITTLLITTTPSIKLIIRYYRLQSFILAVIPLFTTLSKTVMPQGISWVETGLSILFITLLPLLLGLFIKYFLERATIGLPINWKRLRLTPSEKSHAERIWQERELPRKVFKEFFVFGSLVALSAWISFQVIQTKPSFGVPEQIGLMVSLSLYLAGLYNTFVKGDIISQVIGLLTMDQGLILAAIKIVKFPSPAALFMVGLYFYTLITLVILLVMFPKVQSFAKSIELNEIANQSNLEG